MNTYIVITSEGPQAGKGTAGKYLADRLNLKHCASSDAITKRVADKLGVTTDYIKTARKLDPDNYRPELINEGKAMVENGEFPTIECFKDGYTVVDGQRFVDEVKAVRQWVYDQGEDLLHVHIVGRSNGTDTTQSEELEKIADCVIANVGTFNELYDKLDRAIELGRMNAVTKRKTT